MKMKMKMKMKNLFFGMSLLAIAGMWTGCSNDDEAIDASSAQQAISFRVQGGAPELRTNATTAANVDAFVVYGTDDAAVAASLDDIFDGITVARQIDGTFDYNPKQYFTTGATTAQFAAFSPVSASIISPALTFAYGTGLSFNYKVVEPTDDGKTSQEDLLVAGTTVTPGTTSPDMVTLPFQHALSRIFVKATNALSQTVTIKALTLENLYSTGEIAGATPWTWPTSWTWTPSGNRDNDYNYVLASTGVAVKSGLTTATLVTSMEQGMMIIPQKIVTSTTPAATDFALKVVYDVANVVGKEAFVYLPNNYEFLKGTQYSITVNFTGTDVIEIGFDITVGKFEDDLFTMP